LKEPTVMVIAHRGYGAGRNNIRDRRHANRTAEGMSESMRGLNSLLASFQISRVRNFMVVPRKNRRRSW
jgi:hypothetical protein